MKHCQVDGCVARYYAKGYCKRHWWQWHEAGSTAIETSKSPGREWLARNTLTLGATDECVIWPFRLSSAGYATVMIGEKNRQVSHLVLEAHGQTRPPRPNNFALHSCDNPACINPHHLRWGSARDNSNDAIERDRMRKGETNGAHRLTADDVLQIRRQLAQGAAKRALARQYGVDQKSIHNIARRTTWGWL